MDLTRLQNHMDLEIVKRQNNEVIYIFFSSFNLLIGWQLSIWNYCKPFFSMLYNCQLLCVILQQAPPQVADQGMFSLHIEGNGEIKYPGCT